MKKQKLFLFVSLLIPLFSCEAKIDYDNPQQVSKSEFKQALALFASGSCTFEIDDDMNAKHGFDNHGEIVTGEIDFKNNIFHGEYKSITPGYEQYGEAFLYYGKNYVVNQYYTLDQNSGKRYDSLTVWENKPQLDMAEMFGNKEWSDDAYFFQVNTDYSSFQYDESTESYIYMGSIWGEEAAIQFASGRVSRIFLATFSGWYKLTKVNATKIDIPSDIKEYGANGPANSEIRQPIN